MRAQRNRLLWLAAGIGLVVMILVGYSSPRRRGSAVARAHLAEAYARLPLRFEANGDSGKFLARGSRYTLSLTATEATLVLSNKVSTTLLRIGLVGGNPQARLSGLDEQPGKTNYLI